MNEWMNEWTNELRTTIIDKQMLAQKIKLHNFTYNCLKDLPIKECIYFYALHMYNGYQELFPGGKAAGAWIWPLTPN
jgi:hypothetical protein